MIAVLDACVLYPPSVRDILMWLAVALVYEPRWTDEIHDEWTRGVLRDRPDITPDQLGRTRRLMDQVSPDCLVTGYAMHIPGLALPDEGDRHVLAAAIHSRASVIVTYNLADFPPAVLGPFQIRAATPDVFLNSLLTAHEAKFFRGIRMHRSSLKNPPMSGDQYLAYLENLGFRRLAHRIRPHVDSL